MTWKAYAIVSGAGLLATYLTLPHPTLAPDPARVRPSAAPATMPALDIREQATRLATRVRSDVEYHEPSRDPFHFGARPAPASPASRAAETAPAPAPELPQIAPPPAAPEVKLSGITTRMSGGSAHRSAIFITPQGIAEVAEGETLAGQYRVVHIEENAVELSGPDGASRRMTLR